MCSRGAGQHDRGKGAYGIIDDQMPVILTNNHRR